MVISRERYLDDTSLHLISVSMATRTTPMHSLLADAPAETHEEIGRILAEASARVVSLLKPLLAERAQTRTPTSFGCGT